MTDNQYHHSLNRLYQTWVQSGYQGNITIFEPSRQLDSRKSGFVIKPDGRFLERKNAGWCGTPPITYKDYQGHWIKLSDSLLEITVGYWGGTTSYQMKIVSLSSQELKILYYY